MLSYLGSFLTPKIQNCPWHGVHFKIPGFGIFEVRERAARTGKNPRTGEPVEIQATKAPSFKAGKALKDSVNVWYAMTFKRVVLGLSPHEVNLCIQGLQDQIEEKDKTIKEMENRIMRLEFDKDDLEAELNVYKTIHQSRAVETEQNV